MCQLKMLFGVAHVRRSFCGRERVNNYWPLRVAWYAARETHSLSKARISIIGIIFCRRGERGQVGDALFAREGQAGGLSLRRTRRHRSLEIIKSTSPSSTMPSGARWHRRIQLTHIEEAKENDIESRIILHEMYIFFSFWWYQSILS